MAFPKIYNILHMTLNAEKKLATEVLVIGTGSLLDQAITNLIVREPGVHVATITVDEPSAFLKETDCGYHDVILLCETSSLDQADIFEILNRIPIHEHLRLIVIRRENNILEVYDKKSVELTHNANADLITLILQR
jgi:hypothetical protein